MRERALELVRGIADPSQALCLLREYLQVLVLQSLHEAEAFRPLAFVGGTALRLLHGLPRFSEDSDFSLVVQRDYDGKAWLSKVKRDLDLAGFETEVTWNERRPVHAGWVRIPGLLREAGLGGPAGQKLAIKLEIDTRPPSGARCERRILTRHVTFLVQHHDLPSLLAGKLHALLARAYAKGRDLYDLVWYLSRQPPVQPNLDLLQNALDQTEGKGRHDAGQWRKLVRARLRNLDTAAVVRDVLPFLERPREAELLTAENLQGLLAE